MLKIVKNPEFTATVKVRIPAEGGHTDASFTARFRTLSVSEAAEFDLTTPAGTADWLRAVLIGWEGVVDDDGDPVSFGAAARDELIDVPFIRRAVADAYGNALLGAKRGN